MAGKSSPPKRRSKTVQLGDMIGGALDPALKRRGFASRDLIAHWQAIAPAPWDTIAMPDKLVWPRRGAPEPEGAVLHLRCREGHGLALAHEGPAIAGAVNRYFGYLLVKSVRLSPTPLEGGIPAPVPGPKPLDTTKAATLRSTTAKIEDEGLRDALEKLGRGILSKS